MMTIAVGEVLATRAFNLGHSRCCLAAWETARGLLLLGPPATGTVASQSKERFDRQSTKSYHDISRI